MTSLRLLRSSSLRMLTVAALLLSPALLVGCGPNDGIDDGRPDYDDPQTVAAATRPMLEKYAKSGQLDSGMGTLGTAFGRIEDETTRKELQTMMGELSAAGKPAATKAKAKEMLEKLDAYAGAAPAAVE